MDGALFAKIAALEFLYVYFNACGRRGIARLPLHATLLRVRRFSYALLLLFNTTRAHSPDPQARGPLSLWTEVWPTQLVLTQHPY